MYRISNHNSINVYEQIITTARRSSCLKILNTSGLNTTLLSLSLPKISFIFAEDSFFLAKEIFYLFQRHLLSLPKIKDIFTLKKKKFQ